MFLVVYAIGMGRTWFLQQDAVFRLEETVMTSDGQTCKDERASDRDTMLHCRGDGGRNDETQNNVAERSEAEGGK